MPVSTEANVPAVTVVEAIVNTLAITDPDVLSSSATRHFVADSKQLIGAAVKLLPTPVNAAGVPTPHTVPVTVTTTPLLTYGAAAPDLYKISAVVAVSA